MTPEVALDGRQSTAILLGCSQVSATPAHTFGTARFRMTSGQLHSSLFQASLLNKPRARTGRHLQREGVASKLVHGRRDQQSSTIVGDRPAQQKRISRSDTRLPK